MPPESKNWIIYGANGYTGRLIAMKAVAKGHRPILAGRDRTKVESLANQLGCPFRVFSLANAAANLGDVGTVLNCAGPFSQTAPMMIEACLQAGVHYLDITGEIDIIELAARQHDRAEKSGVILMPAVGFDVVPSDCLAVQLATALPSATELELAFMAFGDGATISPGTSNTVLTQVGHGGRVRIDGDIRRVPVAWQSKLIQFPSGEHHAVTIPWGDVASAFHSTGIPNIRVYTAMPSRQIKLMQRWRWLLPLARLAPIQWLGRRWIQRNIQGPSETERARGHMELWGRVADPNGGTAEATLVTPEGYTLTARTAVEAVSRVMAGEVHPGFSTPAKAFGGAFIEQFPGVRLEWRTRPEQPHLRQ